MTDKKTIEFGSVSWVVSEISDVVNHDGQGVDILSFAYRGRSVTWVKRLVDWSIKIEVKVDQVTVDNYSARGEDQLFNLADSWGIVNQLSAKALEQKHDQKRAQVMKDLDKTYP